MNDVPLLPAQAWRLDTGTVRGFDSGPGEDPVPVLYLHSMGGDLDEAALLLQRLAPKKRVLAHDHPGMGKWRTHEEPQPMDVLADTAAAVIRRVAGGGPVDVVGSSMGSVVTLHLADQYPDLVRRVVLQAPGGAVEEFAGKDMVKGALQQWMRATAPLYALAPVGAAQMASNMFWTWVEAGAKPEEVGTWARWTARRHLAKPLGAIGRETSLMFAHLIDAEPLPVAGRVTHPTLVLYGTADAIPTTQETPFLYEQAMADARVQAIQGARHMFWLSHPDETAAYLLDFLGGVSPAEGVWEQPLAPKVSSLVS